LPRRTAAHAARDDGSIRAERPLGARRREYPLALRENARAMARALRGERRPGAQPVRRDVRARVAVVPDGLYRGLYDRRFTAFPGSVLALGREKRSLDARRCLRRPLELTRARQPSCC